MSQNPQRPLIHQLLPNCSTYGRRHTGPCAAAALAYACIELIELRQRTNLPSRNTGLTWRTTYSFQPPEAWMPGIVYYRTCNCRLASFEFSYASSLMLKYSNVGKRRDHSDSEKPGPLSSLAIASTATLVLRVITAGLRLEWLMAGNCLPVNIEPIIPVARPTQTYIRESIKAPSILASPDRSSAPSSRLRCVRQEAICFSLY